MFFITIVNGEININQTILSVSINNLGVTSKIKIDGMDFKSDSLITNKDTVSLKNNTFSDISFKYTYTTNNVKEEIILNKDRILSFPLTLNKNSKLIKWYNDEWKIVSINSPNTMEGIVLNKPYGIDSKNNYIDMKYEYNNNELQLVYDRKIVSYESIKLPNGSMIKTLTKKYSDISYPLVIDPTWTFTTDHWVNTTSEYTLLKWNTTGTTTWSVPSGVTEIEFLVVGAGGGVITSNTGVGAAGGGGGGEMAFNNTSALFPVSGTITVTVGAGIYQGNGTASNFSSIGANGGGLASAYPQTNYWIGFNNSAGGCSWDTLVGYVFNGKGLKSSIYGNSKDGGFGVGYFSNPGNAGGGGGGAGVKGYNSSGNAGGNGGNGLQSNITGELIYYAGGGGGGSYYSTAVGAGGLGGGGTGISAKSVNGTDEFGGGAGAGYGISGITGARGGNGVVIIKYYAPLVLNPPTASFNITLSDNSTFTDAYDRFWNITNLTGDNIERTYSTNTTLLINENTGFTTGNYFINLVAYNSGGVSYANKTIGLNLTSPIVHFWERMG